MPCTAILLKQRGNRFSFLDFQSLNLPPLVFEFLYAEFVLSGGEASWLSYEWSMDRPRCLVDPLQIVGHLWPSSVICRASQINWLMATTFSFIFCQFRTTSKRWKLKNDIYDVICVMVPYCGTNIVGPDQTPRYLSRISIYRKYICHSQCRVNHKYYHWRAQLSDLGFNYSFRNKAPFSRWRHKYVPRDRPFHQRICLLSNKKLILYRCKSKYFI